MIYFSRARKFCAPPHHLWKLYSICCQSVAWYELKQTITIFPLFFNPKLAQSANSIYGFYKFRRDASKELFEQLQSHDNIPQKLLPFIFITTDDKQWSTASYHFANHNAINTRQKLKLTKAGEKRRNEALLIKVSEISSKPVWAVLFC